MACERWREMLSAQLDGEDDPADRPRVDEHLAGCAGCRQWLDRAATVNRITRTGLAAPIPDLTAAILAAIDPAAAAPGAAAPSAGAGAGSSVGTKAARSVGAGAAPVRGWPSPAGLLYVALAAVGAVQLILGLAQVGDGAAGSHVHLGGDATPGHLWHESAAWNVAVGAAYLFIALRRNRPSGLVPMLTAFVGMLVLLSVNDLTAGRVDATRLVSHGFVIAGYLLVVTLTRVAPSSAQPPGARLGGWRPRFEDDAVPEVAAPLPGLRLVPRPPGPLTATAAAGEERRAA